MAMTHAGHHGDALERPIDEQTLSQTDAQVKADCGQAAEDADDDREGPDSLRFLRGDATEPSQQRGIDPAEPHQLADSEWHLAAGGRRLRDCGVIGRSHPLVTIPYQKGPTAHRR